MKYFLILLYFVVIGIIVHIIFSSPREGWSYFSVSRKYNYVMAEGINGEYIEENGKHKKLYFLVATEREEE